MAFDFGITKYFQDKAYAAWRSLGRLSTTPGWNVFAHTYIALMVQFGYGSTIPRAAGEATLSCAPLRAGGDHYARWDNGWRIAGECRHMPDETDKAIWSRLGKPVEYKPVPDKSEQP